VNDVIFELGPDGNGHRTAHNFAGSGAIRLDVEFLPFNEEEYNVDVEKCVSKILQKKPRLIILGSSTFLFPHPVRDLKEIAEEAGSILAYDASHVLGLIAGRRFQQPLTEGVDAIVSGTHKTLFGPQGGIILSNDEELFKKIQTGLYPALITNHHLHRIPSLVAALSEMLAFGQRYAEDVVKNAKALARALDEEGVHALYSRKGYTASHTILVDVSEFGGGVETAKRLEDSNLIVNKTMLPRDITNATGPSGIRIGSQEITRRGLKESDMKNVAYFFRRVLVDAVDPTSVATDVGAFMEEHKETRYSFDD
jgi:glycine hydroxymethyltransferase